MKMRNLFLRTLMILTAQLVCFWIFSMPLAAQTAAEGSDEPAERIYSQEELDRLLAPIALYPDALLSQVLMASTYPIEVVEADRWRKKNPDLTGERLDEALKDKSWDISVKSLSHYPDVLGMMSEKLEVTTDMGNAFLGQQEQVMDTVQNLRAKAQAQGNLTSTDKQKVIVSEDRIIIEPARPEVIYVPAYDPCWAYGPWWYASCSHPWFWYPHIVIGAGLFFGPPIFLLPHHFWSGFFWHRHRVFIHVDKTFFFHKHGIGRRHGGIEPWQHSPRHRRGVFYHNERTAGKFGQFSRPGVDARREFRGFSTPQGGSGGPGSFQGGPSSGRGRDRIRDGAGTPRSGDLRRRGGPGVRPDGGGRSGSGQLRQRSSGGGAFQGFDSSGPAVRQDSERGRRSIGGEFRSGGGERSSGGRSGSFGGPSGGSREFRSGGGERRSGGSIGGGRSSGGSTGGSGGGRGGRGGGSRGGGSGRK